MTIRTLTVAGTVLIERERRLPFPGKVLVGLGENVHPEDIIATGRIPSRLQVLDIAKALGVEPSQANACLVREVNEPLDQGDVIAQCEGVVTRLVRMPVNGQLVACDQGLVYLSTNAVTTNLQAGMIGKVQEITPGIGVVISVVGSLLQGVWGNGQVGCGIMQVIDPREDAVVDTSVKGHILALGSCCMKEALVEYTEKGVTGLILGSSSPELVPFFESLPFPVIVMQGFGELPVDSIRFQLLESRSGLVSCINACAGGPFSGDLPEVVIPQPEGEYEDQQDFQELAIGQLVQVNSGNHRGKSGIVKELPEALIRFPSGLELPSAIVHLVSDDEIITTPRRNLLVIG